MKSKKSRRPRLPLDGDVAAAVATLNAAMGGSPATRADHLLRGQVRGTISVSRGGKRRVPYKIVQQRADRARAKVDPKGLYLIRRDGGLFRPDAHGYTIDLAQAGVFSGEDARGYLDVEGLEIIPLASVRDRIVLEMADTMAGAATRVCRLQALLAKMEVHANV